MPTTIAGLAGVVMTVLLLHVLPPSVDLAHGIRRDLVILVAYSVIGCGATGALARRGTARAVVSFVAGAVLTMGFLAAAHALLSRAAG